MFHPTPTPDRTPPARRPRRAGRPLGFTLVELLVVIGIIALLISILLPTLSRARGQANQVACQSNLRSVGQGFLLYADEYEGLLPYSLIDDAPDVPSGQIGEQTWWSEISIMLGVDPERAKTLAPAGGGQRAWLELTPTLQCSEAQLIPGTGMPAHFTANSRLLPYYDFVDGASDDGTAAPSSGDPAVPPKLSVIRDPSSTGLSWDGPQRLDWRRGSTWLWVDQMEGWRFGFFQWFGMAQQTGAANMPTEFWDLPLNATSNGSPANRSAEAQARYNRDAANIGDLFGVSAVRFRHLDNTRANLLFVDGHVEGRAIGQLTPRDVSADIPIQ